MNSSIILVYCAWSFALTKTLHLELLLVYLIFFKFFFFRVEIYLTKKIDTTKILIIFEQQAEVSTLP